MATATIDPTRTFQKITTQKSQKRVITEEIDGLIRVHNDRHVERPQIVPCVPPSLAPDLGVTCADMIIDKYTNIWSRVCVPNAAVQKTKLPILVYFHGGGFCVGAASWSCYHQFLAKLSSKTGCAVVSVNYRLAPENPLPAAYDDGVKSLAWIKQQESGNSKSWWANKCDFSRIFLAGDSAGANIAYNVAVRVGERSPTLMAAAIKGLVLIQPFIGGEGRTRSERNMVQPPRSALTLAASDTYWRLALPAGASRDHPWCNPMVAGTTAGKRAEMRGLDVLVCVSEMDILRERNLEWCEKLVRDGVRVEKVVFKGVGHAFQILDNSRLAQMRLHELFSCTKNFVTRYR